MALYAYLDAREQLRSNNPALARVNRPGPAVEEEIITEHLQQVWQPTWIEVSDAACTV
jgi:hypothetical protein